ncbi:hypothetical protein HK101_011624, partial [Irineochytrium annulatum]
MSPSTPTPPLEAVVPLHKAHLLSRPRFLGSSASGAQGGLPDWAARCIDAKTHDKRVAGANAQVDKVYDPWRCIIWMVLKAGLVAAHLA